MSLTEAACNEFSDMYSLISYIVGKEIIMSNLNDKTKNELIALLEELNPQFIEMNCKSFTKEQLIKLIGMQSNVVKKAQPHVNSRQHGSTIWDERIKCLISWLMDSDIEKEFVDSFVKIDALTMSYILNQNTFDPAMNKAFFYRGQLPYSLDESGIVSRPIGNSDSISNSTKSFIYKGDWGLSQQIGSKMALYGLLTKCCYEKGGSDASNPQKAEAFDLAGNDVYILVKPLADVDISKYISSKACAKIQHDEQLCRDMREDLAKKSLEISIALIS